MTTPEWDQMMSELAFAFVLTGAGADTVQAIVDTKQPESLHLSNESKP